MCDRRNDGAPCRSTFGVEGRMVALRCTQRLLRRLRPDQTTGNPGAARNALGHWYANVVSINRSAFVLAISERSLLSVVLPGPPFGSLTIRFPEVLGQLLRALAVPGIQIARELSLTSPVTIAATANRQVINVVERVVGELTVNACHVA